MEKIVRVHIDGLARLFRVAMAMSAEQIRAAFCAALMEAKSKGLLCLTSELPLEILSSYGLTPCGAEEIHVENRDLRNEALQAHGLALANCVACAEYEDGICTKHGHTPSNAHLTKDCCLAERLYSLRYTQVSQPPLVVHFIVTDDTILRDETELTSVLFRCLPELAAEHSDIGEVSIRPVILTSYQTFTLSLLSRPLNKE